MRILNLTSNPLDIINSDGYGFHLPVSGPSPSLSIETKNLGQVAIDLDDDHSLAVDLFQAVIGKPGYNLPEPEENVLLVVPAIVATHPSVAWRKDLVFPGQEVVSPKGNFLGHRGLCAGPGLARLSSQDCVLPQGWFGGLGQ